MFNQYKYLKHEKKIPKLADIAKKEYIFNMCCGIIMIEA